MHAALMEALESITGFLKEANSRHTLLHTLSLMFLVVQAVSLFFNGIVPFIQRQLDSAKQRRDSSSSTSKSLKPSRQTVPGCAAKVSMPGTTFADEKRRQDAYDPSPRTGYLEWDDYFMALAFLSAQRSKDPSKQVGAVIVGANRVVLGIGYNGFPRGCADNALSWSKKAYSGDPLDTKYPYVVHAEANALLNKNAAAVEGATVYVTMFPCNECAKLLIQAGVKEVVYNEGKVQHNCEGSSIKPSESSNETEGMHACDGVQHLRLNRWIGIQGSEVSTVCHGAVDQSKREKSGQQDGIGDQSKGEESDRKQVGKRDQNNVEKSAMEASYRASLKLLTLAGVQLRQHCLARTVVLSGLDKSLD